MTETATDVGRAALTDEWLLVKRDLYFRPGCKGYTGIRDEAGRYSYDFARSYENSETSMVHVSEAPEFRATAFSDLVVAHLIKQRDEVRAALTAAKGSASSRSTGEA